MSVMLHCEADYEFYLREMASLSESVDKPIVLTPAEATAVSEWGRGFLAENRLAVIHGLGRFLTALRVAADYRSYRQRHVLSGRASSQLAKAAKAWVTPIDGLPTAAGVVSDADTWRLLGQAGLPLARTCSADSAKTSAEAADALGYPVVLKASGPGLTHKSDLGGVVLGLKDHSEVERTGLSLLQSVSGASTLVVQEMVTDGLETYIGAVRSEEFGPLILVGLGGIFVELLGDVSVRLAPVDRQRASQMLGELKGARLLSGLRGKPPADQDALIDIVINVSRFVASLGERLSELDLNPVIVRPKGSGVRIVDALLVLR